MKVTQQLWGGYFIQEAIKCVLHNFIVHNIEKNKNTVKILKKSDKITPKANDKVAGLSKVSFRALLASDLVLRARVTRNKKSEHDKKFFVYISDFHPTCHNCVRRLISPGDDLITSSKV